MDLNLNLIKQLREVLEIRHDDQDKITAQFNLYGNFKTWQPLTPITFFPVFYLKSQYTDHLIYIQPLGDAPALNAG